uniref:Putative retrotransposon protein n=1 Tax=Oryza sativa subsp. indica TaxID=39946 RepID=C5NNT2_ORYSI|nr:putative retrotransposon protein [Oryza sativa Indica Group]
MIFQSFNLLENREKGKRERDDVSPGKDDHDVTQRRPARDRELAGARDFGGRIGGHQRVAGDETNSTVPTPTRGDARRRPATKKKAAAARVDGVGGAPVVGDANGGADGLPLLTANLTVVAATGGDGGDGAAAMPKDDRRRRRLNARGDGARKHGRTRERGQTREEITGNIYMSSNRRDRAANERNQIGKNSDSFLEINSKPNSNLLQNSTICFDSWGKRKRRPRGTKPLKNPKRLSSDSAGFDAGRRR